MERIKEKWQEEGHKMKDMISLNIYPNIHDKMIYYVINDTIEDKFSIEDL